MGLMTAASAYWARVQAGDLVQLDAAHDAYLAGWEDGYKTARQEAGQEREGGGDDAQELGVAGSAVSHLQGEQASGDLLARHLPCPLFTSMLLDTLHGVRVRQITAPEQRAVDDCLKAVRDLIARLGGRMEDR